MRLPNWAGFDVVESNRVSSARQARVFEIGLSSTDQTSDNGNISADPIFIDKLNEDYQLSLTSPAIDAGDTTAEGLPATDITANNRIVDGYLNTIAQVDLGAYEFTP